MASSIVYGSFSGTSTVNVRPAIEWSSTPNTAGNSSDVTATLVFYRYNTSWGSWNAGGHYVSFKVDTSTLTENRTFDIRDKSREVIWTRTRRVDHNSDGSKAMSLSASGSTGTSLGSYNFSGTATLDTIPRASSINSFSDFSMINGQNNNFDLSLSRESSIFTHDITLRVDGETIQSWNGQGLPSSLTIDATNSNRLLNIMRNHTAMTAQLRVQTKSGSTNVASVVTRDATVSVHSILSPSISDVSITEYVSSIRIDLGVFVQNKSRLSIDLSVVAGYGARDGTFKITYDGTTYNSKSVTTSTIRNSGTRTIGIEYVNSRNQKVTTTRQVTVYQYVNPEPRITAMYRTDVNGNADDEGAYATVEFSGAISSLNGANEQTYQLRYKRSDESYYTDEIVSSIGTFIFPADKDYAYSIQFVASDYFTSIPAYAEVLPTFSLINFSTDGKGLAFGGAYDNTLGGTVQVDGFNIIKNIFSHSSNGGTQTVTLPGRGLYLVIVSPAGTDISAKVALVSHWYDDQMTVDLLNAGSSSATITLATGGVELFYTTWCTYSVVKLTA